MKNNYQKIAENIKEKFESHLFSFPINRQWHFAERLYRITGENIYIQPIKLYFVVNKEKFFDLINFIDDKKQLKNIGYKYIQRLKEKKDPRISKRIPIYNAIPEFKSYQELIWFLKKISDYSLNLLDKKKSREILGILRNIDFTKYLFNESLIKVDPVQTINTVFHLKQLQIVDITKEVISLIQKLFLSIKTQEDYYNKLYSYTHIIISSSNYFQKFLYFKEWKEFFSFFEKEQDKILNLNNKDIIAEIGVCYKLAQITNNTLEKIKILIFEEINRNNGILLRECKNIKYKLHDIEHENVLAILLFSKWDKLYEGPSIMSLEKI